MTVATETAAPAAQTEPQTSVQAPQVPAQPATLEPDKEPQWLGARLDRERRSVLKQLGVENVDDAKAAIAELRKRQDAEKSETDKLRAELAESQKVAARAATLESVIASQAQVAIASLTESQREAVIKLAGDDAPKQLSAIEALKPTWAVSASSVDTTAQTQAQPKQAPLSTSAATPAPSPSASETENHKATYERLLKQDPQRAAAYRLANWSRFFEGR